MGLPDNADVAELVDALDLGSSAERRGGSSPFIRTTDLGCLILPLPDPDTVFPPRGHAPVENPTD